MSLFRQKLLLVLISLSIFFGTPSDTLALTSKQCSDLQGQKWPINNTCPQSFPNSSGSLAAPFSDYQCCLKKPVSEKQKRCYNSADEVVTCADAPPSVSESDCGSAFGGIAVPKTSACPDTAPYLIAPISSTLNINRNCCGSRTTPAIPVPQVGNANNNQNSSTGVGQLNYQLLEKVPGFESAGSDMKTYIEALYKLALVIVTLSAVLMLSIGGFMYLTSAGNTAQMASAKGVIFDSLIGLIIALAAWLLLYVINPDFININLRSFSPIKPGAAAPANPSPFA